MTSGQPIDTDGASRPVPASAWICGLLQTADSFYPTGSYAHSFGLEGLIQEGVVRDRETLRHYLFQAVLPSLQRVELPVAAQAWRAFAGPDWERIGDLCVLASALRSAREAREASERIGRQRAELMAALRDSPLAREFLERAATGRWPLAAPVAAALEARVLGAPLEAMLAGVTYATVGSLLSAAMKLLRLGQNGAQSLLAETLSDAPGRIEAALNVADDDIGWANPWLDIAAARHEHADARMFIS